MNAGWAGRIGIAIRLTRVEARLLLRNLLVWAGLVAGAAVVWELTRSTQPVWWNAGWQIGYGQVVVSMLVLIAAHLATGRVHRDGLRELYASFPTAASTRTLGQLIGLVGALPASLLLAGAAVTVLDLRGAIGTPNAAAVVGGVLLVLAAGAIGVAVAIRFPHPLAGLLAAFVWLVPFSQSNRFSGGFIWLFPWVVPQQLKQVPGPLAGYPPAAAHAVQLFGIALLAGAVALALSGRPRWGSIAVAAVAIAVVCIAAITQLRPIPTKNIDHLIAEVTNPATAQQCTNDNDVNYCLYPGFGRQLHAIRAPVSAVLTELPARPGQPLTVRQVATPTLYDPTLTHGHSAAQVAQWKRQAQAAPANRAAASAIYLTAGSWPAPSHLSGAQFALALGTAEWAVGLPPTTGAPENNTQCLPVDQAREAIAIFLAIRATHPSSATLRAGLSAANGASGFTAAVVHNTVVQTWRYPGENASYLAAPGPQTTAAGYLLAKAMAELPAQTVIHVLDTQWTTWLDWHTTDVKLAAALGIPSPSLPTRPAPERTVTPPPGGGPPPQNPVCTT